MMRFAVESWAPDYGSPVGPEPLDPTDVTVDPAVEVPAAEWAPRSPVGAAQPQRIRFVDGVRRIDAWLWITDRRGDTRPGIAASYAAGITCCDGAAVIEWVEVRRGAFSASPALVPVETRHGVYLPHAVAGDAVEQLSQELQQQMGRLEALVAGAAEPGDLVVVDGPLNRVPGLTGAVGYVKTHQKRYLPSELSPVIASLAPGQRTPLFLTTTNWSRYSWYARLPGASPATSHPWSGIVRGEASGDLGPVAAARLADTATAALPRYASIAYKDPRAPQNLFPIAGLERALRHRLGDVRVLERALRAAAGRAAPRPVAPR